MCKRIIAALVLIFLLTGCSTTTEITLTEGTDTNSTEETNPIIENTEEVTVPSFNISETDALISASLWGEQKTTKNNKPVYTYSIFVSSNDIYATPRANSVKILKDNEYIDIKDFNKDIQVETVCINEGFGDGTAAFIKITSPKMLDAKKIYIEILGSKDFKVGMLLTTAAEYEEKYGKDSLYQAMLALNMSGMKDADAVFEKQRPLAESIRLVNRGDGYDLIFFSTKATKSEIKDNILWTPVDVKYMTDCDYMSRIKDIFNSCYVAKVPKNGLYEDIEIVDQSKYEIQIEYQNGKLMVGIKALDGGTLKGDDAPNCIIANTVMADGQTNITVAEGQRAIIVLFN